MHISVTMADHCICGAINFVRNYLGYHVEAIGNVLKVNCLKVRESRVRLRALFDYNPRKDTNIPCQDAGLSFSKGDILHIVSQEDPFWYEQQRTLIFRG